MLSQEVLEMSVRFVCLQILLVIAFGCTGLGPRNLPSDRTNYADAISESWKRETLLNIVKLRHGDAPVFLQVTGVISQRSTSAGTSVSANWPVGTRGIPTVSGSTSFSETPTISYRQLQGEEFFKCLMTPVPPCGVLLLANSGWPADILFWCGVDTVNDLHNTPTAFVSSTDEPADPDFARLVEILARNQSDGVFTTRYEMRTGAPVVILTIPLSAEGRIGEDIAEIRKLANLAPTVTEFTVVYGVTTRANNEIAMKTRSVLGMMAFLARSVDLPAGAPSSTGCEKLLNVKTSAFEPPNAFTSVRYQGRWYYIDQDDTRSKSAMSLVMVALSLAQSGTGIVAPVVTVSAGGK